MLVSRLAYSSTLKMEATCSSETSINFQWTTWRYIPEPQTLHFSLHIKYLPYGKLFQIKVVDLNMIHSLRHVPRFCAVGRC
jgi:hypothetical protein